MTLVLRPLALLGSVAAGVDQLVGRLLGFLPFRVPGALLVAALLGVAAWSAAAETGRAIASRPVPVDTSIGSLVDEPTTSWVSVSGLLSGPHLDNSIYASDRRTHYLRISDDPHDHVIEGSGEPLMEPGIRQTIFPLTTGDGVTRWFYVLRDVEGADRALVVRSARGADEIRTRSVSVVANGLVDGLPHLVEVADAAARPPSTSLSSIAEGGSETIRVALDAEAAPLACDGGDACHDGRTWRYLVADVADPNATAWLDSPHAPDELPVTLNGVVATDATRMRIVLAADEMRAALDGLAHRDDLVFADGISPIVPEASYLGAVILGTLGVVLLLSATIRYPVFRRDDEIASPDRPRPVVDELIDVTVDGELPGVSGVERPAGAPARIGWLPARELARQAWHLHNEVPNAGSDQPRLALVAIEGGFVLAVDPIRHQLRVEPGQVATSTTVRPGLRLNGPSLRLVLGFASAADRDRVVRELGPMTDPPPVGPVPEPAPRRQRARRPWARPVTAAALAATALLVAGGGLRDLLTAGPAPIGAGAALAAALPVGVLALGIARRHPLATDLLPSVALLGLVVAGVMAVALPGCGTWLTPNLADCGGLDAIALVTTLAAVLTFGLSLWAGPHLAATAGPG